MRSSIHASVALQARLCPAPLMAPCRRAVSHLPFLLKMIGIPTAFFTTSTVANWGLSLPVSRAFKYKCGTLVDEHASLLEE